METAPTIFRPRIMPRDVGDVLIVIFVALPCQIFPLFFLPTLVVFFLTGNLDIAFSVFVLIYLVFLAFSVWSVRADAAGLRFKRFLGTPKFLAWSDIRRVSEATRSEVIVHGWLWPLLPAREMTPALSARGHIRIEWDDGYCYFPPRDPKGFLTYVRGRVPSNVA
jgi:hypothetical protein